MPVAYVPHVSPKNNNTQQMRRRLDDVVDTITNQVGSLSSGNGDLGTLNTTKAPIASPTFQGTVGVTGASVVTAATAGAATALPATPSGYVTQMINGKAQRIPFYD